MIRDEELVPHALQIGDFLLKEFRGLMNRHQLIGDVRGEGLFLSVELVCDRDTRVPATRAAADLVNY